jgi:hypothetical protein
MGATWQAAEFCKRDERKPDDYDVVWTMEQQRHRTAKAVIWNLYLLLMASCGLCILAVSVFWGFRPMQGTVLIGLLDFFVVPTVLLLSICYFVFSLVRSLRVRRWRNPIWTALMIIGLIVLVMAEHPLRTLGWRLAYHYAGLDELSSDADAMMARFDGANAEIDRTEFPMSFKRVGAYRVYASKTMVTIERGGFAGKRYGIVVFAEKTVDEDFLSEYHARRVRNRIYEWNT